MIQNDRELQATTDRLARLQAQAAHLRQTETNPANYRASVAGFLAEIDRMQLEVREYFSVLAVGNRSNINFFPNFFPLMASIVGRLQRFGFPHFRGHLCNGPFDNRSEARITYQGIRNLGQIHDALFASLTLLPSWANVAFVTLGSPKKLD